MSIEKIFKPYILHSGGYKGGPAAANKGKKVFKLSSNENYFGTSPYVQETIKTRLNNLNIYPSGNPMPLYQALSGFYKNALNANEHFIAGNSGSELIQLICTALLGPDTECIISTPCFAPYQMFASWTGAKVIDVPLDPRDYSLNATGILEKITDKTRILFLTSPNNPTGTCVKESDLEFLLDSLPDHMVILFDEVYYQFADQEYQLTALPYVLKGKNIIGLNSFSKAYGMASLRLGYAYSTPTIINYLQKLIRPFLINDLTLHAGLAALNDQDFIQSTVTKIKAQRARLLEGVHKMGLRAWPSQANFILLDTELDDQKVARHMADQGVMVRPTWNFGAPRCIRITVGDEEATSETLRALATIYAN